MYGVCVCRQGGIGQVDVDSVIEPLRQIVPTLLDVPDTIDEVLPRPATDTDILADTRRQDLSRSEVVEETHPSLTLIQHDVNYSDSPALDQSVDELQLSEGPSDPTPDTVVPVEDVPSDIHTGIDDIIGDVLLEQEQT